MKKENELMLVDLKRSGLTNSDVKTLRLSPLSCVATGKLFDREIESYKIPYFDVNGKDTDFYRLRFTGIEKGFGARTKIRYTQPPDMSPQFYYSKSIDWKKIKDNVDSTIVFTEGEKKAAVLCKHKINCIGLGGVWNWKSKTSYDGLSKDYHDIKWHGRDVYITFDSDITTNPHIQLACYSLCMQLLKDGANVGTLHIPHEQGVKMGVDDYILKYGVKAFKGIKPEEFGVLNALHEINAKFIYCASPPVYIELSTMNRFRYFEFSKHIATIQYTYSNAQDKEITAPALETWVGWSKRNQCAGVAFEPGQGHITKDNKLNTFRSDSVKPVKPTKNQLKPFHDFVKFMFERESPEVLKHFLQWCAYPFQHPGNKIYHSILFQSTQTGVGKSLMGLTLGKLYGSNFHNGSSKILEGQFNGWAVNTRFVLVDEISSENNGAKQRRESNNIKNMVTREVIEINVKNHPEYSVNDYIHYILTSNHPNALYLDAYDRRFLIISAPLRKLSDEFYSMYDKWYKDTSNQQALMHYLMYSVNLKGFNPKAKPPETVSHDAMVETSRTDVESWINDLKEVPHEILQFKGTPLAGDLWMVKDINNLYRSQTQDIIKNKALSLKLLDVNIPFLQVTNPRRTYFILQNFNKWRKKKAVQLHKHYTETRAPKIDSRLIAPIKKETEKC